MTRSGLSVQDDVSIVVVAMQQEPLRQLGEDPEHTAHVPPADPHADVLEPGSHPPWSQQPDAHELAVHAQLPLTHSRPAPHVPMLQMPPQWSLAPQAAFVHSGTHGPA